MGILKDAFGIGVKVFKGARAGIRAKRAAKKAKRLGKKSASADAATSALLSKLGFATGIPNVNNAEMNSVQSKVFPSGSKAMADTSDSWGDDENDQQVHAQFASMSKRDQRRSGIPSWIWYAVGGVVSLVITILFLMFSRKRR